MSRLDCGASYSVPVLRRILRALDSHGPGMKRTKLAGSTGLNYGTCVRYVEFLQLLRWVSLSQEYGGLVSLTPMGREFSILLEQIDPAAMTNMKAENLELGGHSNPLLTSGDNESILEKHRKSDGAFDNSNHVMARTPSKGNVMIIDDDKDVLLTYEVWLSQCGFKVHAFSDPSVALREFKKSHRSIDLVVSDIRMKSINGIQLYIELKTIRPDIRFLFVSALDAAPEITSALPGFKEEDLISKPVDQPTFSRTIEAAVVQHRARAEDSDDGDSNYQA